MTQLNITKSYGKEKSKNVFEGQLCQYFWVVYKVLQAEPAIGTTLSAWTGQW